MQIVVCMAQVPATDIKARIASDGKSLDTGEVKFVINPYDEYAIEEAIRTKEKFGGEVLLLSFGPERTATALREGLALGADRAEHMVAGEGYHDSFIVASILAERLKNLPKDIIFLGKMGVGFDHHQVGAMVAEILNLPHIAAVSHVEISEEKATARRDVEGAVEIVETPLPAVITAEKGLNEPRYASLKGIMAAKRKPLETIQPADMEGADSEAKLIIEKMELPKAKDRGRLIDAEDPAQAAFELIRLLAEEAKVL